MKWSELKLDMEVTDGLAFQGVGTIERISKTRVYVSVPPHCEIVRYDKAHVQFLKPYVIANRRAAR